MAAFSSSIGISRMWDRKSLVVLIYALGLVLAALVGSALFRILSVEIGPTGFSQHLIERFDIVLWFDYWEGIASGMAGIAPQMALAGIIMMIWKVATSVGLIHALQGDASTSFWEGVSRFTIRGVGLGLLYVLPLLLLLVLAGITLEMSASSMGEVGAFWTRFIGLPIVIILLVATFDLFHDYARMHLVLRGATIRRSWLQGIKWPFQHFRSVFLYKIWFWISAALWIAVLLVGFYMPDQSVGAVMLAFIIQQGLIVFRTGAYVSWIGAEVAFFERYAPPPRLPYGTNDENEMMVVSMEETVRTVGRDGGVE